MIRTFAASCFIVLLSATLAPAQDVSEVPDGVICRPPECDVRKTHPPHAGFPYEASEPLVNRVKRTPASALGSRLPRMPFETWLSQALEAHLPYIGQRFANWGLSYCEEPASAHPTVSADLCVEVEVPLMEKKTASVIVGVATARTVNGLTSWKEIVPVVRRIYIAQRDEKGRHDSLDVKTLSDLEAQAALPADQWPTVDLKSSITFSPGKPLRGQPVRFTISISNAGLRDADRAHVNIYLGIPDDNQEMKEIRRDWFPRVPAGRTVSFDISATLGRGDATIMVNTRAFGPVREGNEKDNDAVAEIPFIIPSIP